MAFTYLIIERHYIEMSVVDCALTTGQRCQTLTLLDISMEFMHKMDDCYQFALTVLDMQNRTDRVKYWEMFVCTSIQRKNCVYTKL